MPPQVYAGDLKRPTTLPSGSTNCAKVTTSGVEIAEGGRVGCHVGRLAVSQHLKVLKRAGLVSDRAVGTRRVYEVDQRGLEAAQRCLGSFWSDALSRFKRAADGGRAARK